MDLAAIYHRPDSEFAFLYQPDRLRVRLQTASNDVEAVYLVYGDPYILVDGSWQPKTIRMQQGLITDLACFWTIELTIDRRRLAYAFQVIGVDGTSTFYGDQGPGPILPKTDACFRMPYFQEIDRAKVPEWVKQTVWYQVFPERFANGDPTNDPDGTLPWTNEAPQAQDFYGGDLQGVIDHLDHLVALGINGLYLNPIFMAPSNHKYDTRDYRMVDPHFGNDETLRQLITACHQRGIKVMLDAVFNHLGDQSPQWQDVIQNGAASRYADWFHIRDFPVRYQPGRNFEYATDITYDVFATTPHMPKLNTANPEVQAYLLSIARYWIEAFDIDAWRLDVANEVDHHFWKKFRQVCDAAKPDFYILGEIWHSAQSWLSGDEFSAVMNYAYTDAILDYFIHKKIPLHQMVSKLNRQLMLYRDQINQVQFNILDSHDTPRLLTMANDNRRLMRQTMAFMYLQPGVPCLYYGDEYGMTGVDDPANRKCMVWDPVDQDQAMYQFVKQLIGLRHGKQKLLSEGQLEWLIEPTHPDVLKMTRRLGEQQLTAVFNAGQTAVSVASMRTPILSEGVQQQTAATIIEPDGFMIY